MSTRPTRRATRRQTVIESDSDDDLAGNTTKVHNDDEEDFTPAPRETRRTTRSARNSVAPAAAAPPAAAPRRGRAKKTAAPVAAVEPEEPTEVLEADQTAQTVQLADTTVHADETLKQDENVKPEPESPVAKSTPKKRRSHVPRVSISEATNVSIEAPPTPKPSFTPDTPHVPATPLADITTSTLNTQLADQTRTPATVRPIRAMDSIMDNPIDIVLKQRTMTIPVIEPEEPKSRIVLTHLVLNNFKSYAGRQEVGPFHASFSSVVGPNGSGKSNVIDSLLFVFGFRASKMRQGKISNLIHNSANFPNLEYCEVSVHFKEVMDHVRLSHLITPPMTHH